jgi:hypothetical protein
MTTEEMKAAVKERVNRVVQPFAEVTGVKIVLGQADVALKWLNADGGKEIATTWGFTVFADAERLDASAQYEAGKALGAMKDRVKAMRERLEVFGGAK